MIGFSYGAATSAGRVRRVNEDSYLAVPPLYAVADGMGGHGSGDVASRLAVEVLARCVGLRPLFVEAVLTALEEANRVIIARDEAAGMGTTVTGLAGLETVGGDHLMVFNVGDSRVYRLAADRVEQLTVDHSEVQELVLAGVLTPEQARTHPRRNVITRALGSARALPADYWLLPATGGDRFLICSDGLFGELPDEVILPLLTVGTPQHAAEALVAAAYDAGGHDNVTAVVVDIRSADADADAGASPGASASAGARARSDTNASERAGGNASAGARGNANAGERAGGNASAGARAGAGGNASAGARGNANAGARAGAGGNISAGANDGAGAGGADEAMPLPRARSPRVSPPDAAVRPPVQDVGLAGLGLLDP